MLVGEESAVLLLLAYATMRRMRFAREKTRSPGQWHLLFHKLSVNFWLIVLGNIQFAAEICGFNKLIYVMNRKIRRS